MIYNQTAWGGRGGGRRQMAWGAEKVSLKKIVLKLCMPFHNWKEPWAYHISLTKGNMEQLKEASLLSSRWYPSMTKVSEFVFLCFLCVAHMYVYLYSSCLFCFVFLCLFFILVWLPFFNMPARFLNREKEVVHLDGKRVGKIWKEMGGETRIYCMAWRWWHMPVIPQMQR